MIQNVSKELVREIARKAVVLFADQSPTEIELTSIKADCFLGYCHIETSQLAMMITFSRTEEGQAAITVHDLNSLRHLSRIYSFEVEAGGKFAVHLNAETI